MCGFFLRFPYGKKNMGTMIQLRVFRMSDLTWLVWPRPSFSQEELDAIQSELETFALEVTYEDRVVKSDVPPHFILYIHSLIKNNAASVIDGMIGTYAVNGINAGIQALKSVDSSLSTDKRERTSAEVNIPFRDDEPRVIIQVPDEAQLQVNGDDINVGIGSMKKRSTKSLAIPSPSGLHKGIRLSTLGRIKKPQDGENMLYAQISLVYQRSWQLVIQKIDKNHTIKPRHKRLFETRMPSLYPAPNFQLGRLSFCGSWWRFGR
ncbi:hypothetical protein [Alicyclobacillus fastidiosus]|uniref:hypothetical protein n=1 Tax=Alicyclobacillus fastidiosus TaxID=392011 RepID=UPI0024E05D7D|nr:hypothetical protein [Alicyclobacillus fastidiosus]